jgi:fido (protein-threonine AMPylation protein)
MIEPNDFAALGRAALGNKLGLRSPHGLKQAYVQYTGQRLQELRTAPIPGGFDCVHLLRIHHHLHQDLSGWAGRFRTTDSVHIPASQVEPNVNRLLDRLSRQNHLKGYSPEEWSTAAGGYVRELATIQPFDFGNAITIREFADELARKNALALQWDSKADEILDGAIAVKLQEQESSALRRVVMLAMDTYLPPQNGHVAITQREIDRDFS